VLGLGGNNDPAPSPTVDQNADQRALNFSVTGGDDFESDVATINADLTINDTTTSSTESLSFSGQDIASDNTDSSTGSDVVFRSVDEGTVGAGSEFSFDVRNSDYEIVSWDIEVIWNPSDQDSQTIYSESS
jgi:hypothetical protein